MCASFVKQAAGLSGQLHVEVAVQRHVRVLHAHAELCAVPAVHLANRSQSRFGKHLGLLLVVQEDLLCAAALHGGKRLPDGGRLLLHARPVLVRAHLLRCLRFCRVHARLRLVHCRLRLICLLRLLHGGGLFLKRHGLCQEKPCVRSDLVQLLHGRAALVGGNHLLVHRVGLRAQILRLVHQHVHARLHVAFCARSGRFLLRSHARRSVCTTYVQHTLLRLIRLFTGGLCGGLRLLSGRLRLAPLVKRVLQLHVGLHLAAQHALAHVLIALLRLGGCLFGRCLLLPVFRLLRAFPGGGLPVRFSNAGDDGLCGLFVDLVLLGRLVDVRGKRRVLRILRYGLHHGADVLALAGKHVASQSHTVVHLAARTRQGEDHAVYSLLRRALHSVNKRILCGLHQRCGRQGGGDGDHHIRRAHVLAAVCLSVQRSDGVVDEALRHALLDRVLDRLVDLVTCKRFEERTNSRLELCKAARVFLHGLKVSHALQSAHAGQLAEDAAKGRHVRSHHPRRVVGRQRVGALQRVALVQARIHALAVIGHAVADGKACHGSGHSTSSGRRGHHAGVGHGGGQQPVPAVFALRALRAHHGVALLHGSPPVPGKGDHAAHVARVDADVVDVARRGKRFLKRLGIPLVKVPALKQRLHVPAVLVAAKNTPFSLVRRAHRGGGALHRQGVFAHIQRVGKHRQQSIAAALDGLRRRRTCAHALAVRRVQLGNFLLRDGLCLRLHATVGALCKLLHSHAAHARVVILHAHAQRHGHLRILVVQRVHAVAQRIAVVHVVLHAVRVQLRLDHALVKAAALGEVVRIDVFKFIDERRGIHRLVDVRVLHVGVFQHGRILRVAVHAAGHGLPRVPGELFAVLLPLRVQLRLILEQRLPAVVNALHALPGFWVGVQVVLVQVHALARDDLAAAHRLIRAVHDAGQHHHGLVAQLLREVLALDVRHRGGNRRAQSGHAQHLSVFRRLVARLYLLHALFVHLAPQHAHAGGLSQRVKVSARIVRQQVCAALPKQAVRVRHGIEFDRFRVCLLFRAVGRPVHRPLCLRRSVAHAVLLISLRSRFTRNRRRCRACRGHQEWRVAIGVRQLRRSILIRCLFVTGCAILLRLVHLRRIRSVGLRRQCR